MPKPPRSKPASARTAAPAPVQPPAPATAASAAPALAPPPANLIIITQAAGMSPQITVQGWSMLEAATVLELVRKLVMDSLTGAGASPARAANG